MSKVYIAYWSGSGNTEEMANVLASGARDAGAEVVINDVDSADATELLTSDAVALGCAAMGAEELEEGSMEPFVSSIEEKLSGKKLVLFGSYGWGDGEWMRNWVERMEVKGAVVVGGEGIIACGEPDSEAREKLKLAGEELAK